MGLHRPGAEKGERIANQMEFIERFAEARTILDIGIVEHEVAQIDFAHCPTTTLLLSLPASRDGALLRHLRLHLPRSA